MISRTAVRRSRPDLLAPPPLGSRKMASNRQAVFPTRMALTTFKQKQIGAQKGAMLLVAASARAPAPLPHCLSLADLRAPLSPRPAPQATTCSRRRATR